MGKDRRRRKAATAQEVRQRGGRQEGDRQAGREEGSRRLRRGREIRGRPRSSAPCRSEGHPRARREGARACREGGPRRTRARCARGPRGAHRDERRAEGDRAGRARPPRARPHGRKGSLVQGDRRPLRRAGRQRKEKDHPAGPLDPRPRKLARHAEVPRLGRAHARLLRGWKRAEGARRRGGRSGRERGALHGRRLLSARARRPAVPGEDDARRGRPRDPLGRQGLLLRRKNHGKPLRRQRRAPARQRPTGALGQGDRQGA